MTDWISQCLVHACYSSLGRFSQIAVGTLRKLVNSSTFLQTSCLFVSFTFHNDDYRIQTKASNCPLVLRDGDRMMFIYVYLLKHPSESCSTISGRIRKIISDPYGSTCTCTWKRSKVVNIISTLLGLSLDCFHVSLARTWLSCYSDRLWIR